jgi:anti-sigma B factor antagonist
MNHGNPPHGRLTSGQVRGLLGSHPSPIGGLLPVTAETSILVGDFDGFTWIRCEGKGSFLTSPPLKDYAESRITSGERCLVIDLAACTGMDSTFMGTLAGLSTRLQPCEGKVQVAGVNERNRRSLEDLGLDFLLEIEPQDAVWRPSIDSIRQSLSPSTTGLSGINDRARHVLEAHKVLSSANQENAKKFAGVVSLLEAEVAAKPDLDQ